MRSCAFVLVASAAFSADVTYFPNLPRNEQGIGLKDVKIEWDQQGNPVTFTANVDIERPTIWSGLQFDVEIGRRVDGPVAPGDLKKHCGVYLVIDESPLKIPGLFVGSIARYLDGGKCEPSSITYSAFEDTKALDAGRKRLTTEAAAEAAQQSDRRRLIRLCAALFSRTVDKKVGDLTVRETDQIQACRVLGLYR